MYTRASSSSSCIREKGKHREDCVERESVGISNEMCIVGGRIDWKKIESIAERARKDRRSRVIFIDES